jgi:2-keto-3-deoxy-L-rhamnonate aldolase RhmA
MVRSVAEGLGDRLQECVASTRLASRVEALGYRFVSVAADTATTTEQTVQTSAPAEAEPVPSP